jgi:hypothetical protein
MANGDSLPFSQFLSAIRTRREGKGREGKGRKGKEGEVGSVSNDLNSDITKTKRILLFISEIFSKNLSYS